ncbi:hypothetical protein P6709_05810 [Jeotgalibacillus sp. ET6]|uniref:hypothetical protein n=1 Tax=Jeotgalibacillus sp. ET6 TaxID=3037260 RepID=UPI0024183E07|nr:hypothetical protein [Jeotgalibacillus sp. ET6]MDG5471256.1 hypothetical protein [Jeotgalibacillus sp. ET6]
MQKIFSMLFSVLALLFLVGTFFLQYEYLFVTRTILIVFTILYLVIEIKIDYFTENKKSFVFIGILSILSVAVGILVDISLENSELNNRVFFIPLYVFILIVIMYKDFYEQKKH